MMIFHIELKHTVYFIFLRNALKGELNCTEKDCLTTDIFYKKNQWISGKSFYFKSQQNRTREADHRMAGSLLHPGTQPCCCGSGNMTAGGTHMTLWVPCGGWKSDTIHTTKKSFEGFQMTQVYRCVNMVDALCSATTESNKCRQAVTQI